MIVKSDLGNTQQFIDIDGSIVTGTGTTSLTPAEVEQAEDTTENILGEPEIPDPADEDGENGLED